MTNDGDSLLAAILDDPESDDLRLVYADWLEENGEAERAEFIRVQVELAKTECLWSKLDTCFDRRENLMDVIQSGCCNCSTVANKQHKLGDIFNASWLPHCGGELREWYFGWSPKEAQSNPFRFIFHRGFIDTVSLTFAQALDHLPAIVRRHPLRPHAGMVTDKAPSEWSGRWSWWKFIGLDDTDNLQAGIFDLLGKWRPHPDPLLDPEREVYPTCDAAKFALAVSMIEHAKTTQPVTY
jgi:uncharacterized protein (TIGR02996 family)